MPYPQFVKWQLAGDELAAERPVGDDGDGLHRGRSVSDAAHRDGVRVRPHDELDDIVATTGVAFLGLSIRLPGATTTSSTRSPPVTTTAWLRRSTTAIRSEVDMDLEPAANAQRLRQFIARKEELEKEVRDYEAAKLPDEFRQWPTTFDPQEALGPWDLPASPQVSAAKKSRIRTPGGWGVSRFRKYARDRDGHRDGGDAAAERDGPPSGSPDARLAPAEGAGPGGKWKLRPERDHPHRGSVVGGRGTGAGADQGRPGDASAERGETRRLRRRWIPQMGPDGRSMPAASGRIRRRCLSSRHRSRFPRGRG